MGIAVPEFAIPRVIDEVKYSRLMIFRINSILKLEAAGYAVYH